MSDQQWYPPPGSPPGAPPPGEPAQPHWGPAMPTPRPGPGVPPPPGWTPAPGMLGAAHKPGAMPLRPLSLGDVYDAAFRIIRFNPKATVGSAVLVAAVAMVVPVLVTAVLTFTVGISVDMTSSGDIADDDLIGFLAAYGSLGLGAVLQGLGLILVTGMVAHVTAAAAIGQRLTLGEAWEATRGSRWRLVGLAVLLGAATTVIVAAYVVFWVLLVILAPTVVAVIAGILSVPLFLAGLAWFWVRVYYLPVPGLMLERRGVLDSIGRGYRLTGGHFWRTLGIALLTVLIAGVASQVLAFPVSLIGQLGSIAIDPDYTALALIVSAALAQVVSTAFVAPFTSAVASLQYLDLRMRKEAYDVDLMRQAGVLDS